MKKVFEVQKRKEHEIWGKKDAFTALYSLISHYWLFAGEKKIADFYKKIACHGLEIKHPKLHEEHKHTSKSYETLSESFRRFIRYESGYLENTLLCDLISHYLIINRGWCSDKKINSWENVLNNFASNFPLIEAFREFHAGGTIDHLLANKSIQRNTTQEGSHVSLLLMLSEYFGVSEDNYKDGAIKLTPHRKLIGNAKPEQKGYWSLYRLGTQEKTNVVKTRLLVTPPDAKASYCRYRNFTEKTTAGSTRDSDGVVLPVGNYLYLIGGMQDKNGIKIICLSITANNAEVAHGLVMTKSIRGANLLPLVTRMVAVKEDFEDVTIIDKDLNVQANREDLGEFPFDQLESKLFGEDKQATSEEDKKRLELIQNGLLNFDKNEIEKLDGHLQSKLLKAIDLFDH